MGDDDSRVKSVQAVRLGRAWGGVDSSRGEYVCDEGKGGGGGGEVVVFGGDGEGDERGSAGVEGLVCSCLYSF